MSTWAASTALWSDSPPNQRWDKTVSAVDWPTPSYTWATIPYAWDLIEDSVLFESLASATLTVIASGRTSATFVLTAADGTPIGYAQVSVVTQHPASTGDAFSVVVQVFVSVAQSTVPSLLSDVTFSALLSVQIDGSLADTISALVAVNISLAIGVSSTDQVSVRFNAEVTLTANVVTEESLTVSAAFLGQVTAWITADKQINVAIVTNAAISIGIIPGYTVSVDFDVVMTAVIDVVAGESVTVTASFSGNVIVQHDEFSVSVSVSAHANVAITSNVSSDYILNVNIEASLEVNITTETGDLLTVMVSFQGFISVALAAEELLEAIIHGNISISTNSTLFDSISVNASMNISISTPASVVTITDSIAEVFTLSGFPSMLAVYTSGEPLRIWQWADRFNAPWYGERIKELSWALGSVLKGDWNVQNPVEDYVHWS